jgi:hypothetical protein
VGDQLLQDSASNHDSQTDSRGRVTGRSNGEDETSDRAIRGTVNSRPFEGRWNRHGRNIFGAGCEAAGYVNSRDKRAGIRGKGTEGLDIYK